MAKTLRYSVLDSSGTKINAILVEDPYPQTYYPGYGSYIVCDFGEDDPTQPDLTNITDQFIYLTIRPTEFMDMGDSMDINTGVVTKLVNTTIDQI